MLFATVKVGKLNRLWPIMLFWAMLKKVTHYAQYYAHNYFHYAIVQVQILLFLMRSSLGIATLVYIVYVIITVVCCNTGISEHGSGALLRWSLKSW